MPSCHLSADMGRPERTLVGEASFCTTWSMFRTIKQGGATEYAKYSHSAMKSPDSDTSGASSSSGTPWVLSPEWLLGVFLANVAFSRATKLACPSLCAL